MHSQFISRDAAIKRDAILVCAHDVINSGDPVDCNNIAASMLRLVDFVVIWQCLTTYLFGRFGRRNGNLFCICFKQHADPRKLMSHI